MRKRIFWKVLLFIGFLPFVIALGSGIYAGITGYSGLAISGAPVYGFAAFMDWMILYSYIYWPTYVIGLVLIVVSLVQLRKKG